MNDLETYLKERNIWHKFIEKPDTIHTKDAALHTGIDLERITKSLIFIVDENPVVVIAPGNKRVSAAKLCHVLNANNAVLVTFDKAKEYSGYDPGGTPPVNHKNVSKTIIDKKLLDYKTIYGGGGSRNKLIELNVEDIINLTNAVIADVIE